MSLAVEVIYLYELFMNTRQTRDQSYSNLSIFKCRHLAYILIWMSDIKTNNNPRNGTTKLTMITRMITVTRIVIAILI